MKPISFLALALGGTALLVCWAGFYEAAVVLMIGGLLCAAEVLTQTEGEE